MSELRLGAGFRPEVISNNPSALADLLQRHVNVVFLIQVPVLALFCRLLFWRDGFNAAEFLVLAAYPQAVSTFTVSLAATFWFR